MMINASFKPSIVEPEFALFSLVLRGKREPSAVDVRYPESSPG